MKKWILLIVGVVLLSGCTAEEWDAFNRSYQRGAENFSRQTESNQKILNNMMQNQQRRREIQQMKRLNCTTTYVGNQAYTNCY